MTQQRSYSQQAYCQTVATSPTQTTIIDQRDPTANDIYYQIGTFWINQPGNKLWYLNTQSNSTGQLQSMWDLISFSTAFLSLSDTANTVVFPSSGSAVPPNNIQLVGAGGVTVVASPSSNLLTITGPAASTNTVTGNDEVEVSFVAGNLNLIGQTVANGMFDLPVWTHNNSNPNEIISVQVSTAAVSGNINNAGLASFNSAQFTVNTSTGFVSLFGGTTGPVLGLTPDATSGGGTSPVIPNSSGDIIVSGVDGSTFATGTQANPIKTVSTAANTLSIDVQLAGSNAGSSTANNFGVAQFDANQFNVVSGFVQLKGGTTNTVLGLTPDATSGGGTSPVIPNSSGDIIVSGVDGSTFATGTQANPIKTVSTAANTLSIDVQLAGSNPGSSTPNNFGVVQFDSNEFNVVSGFVQLKGGTTQAVLTLSDDSNTTVQPNSSGNIQLVGHVNEQSSSKFSTIVATAASHLINVNPMSSSRWIVDPLGFNGTHTTIGSALTSAQSGDTIFLLPGIYAENPALVTGVNICAYFCDGFTPNVTINGQCTYSGSGTVTMSGIRLQTNSNYFLSVTGSTNSTVNLVGCYLNASNHTGINFSSSGGATIFCLFCNGDTGTTGIAMASNSSSGSLNFSYCNFTNSGGTTTSIATSSGTTYMRYCVTGFLLSTSSSGNLDLRWNIISATNQTLITTAGTGAATVMWNALSSGTSSTISVGSGTSVTACNNTVNSSATNVFTGSGTINTGGNVCNGTSSGNNVSTINHLTVI
jgi:hypothetical protein